MMTDFRVEVRGPRPSLVRCVGCGVQLPHDTALPVDVRYTTPYTTAGRVIRGVGDGWSYSWIDNLQLAAMNASATMMGNTWRPAGYVEPTPTSLYHTHSGYACSREHADQGARALRQQINGEE